MGVDVLIVVDCGFPLLERNKLDSVATVSNQMLAILIRQQHQGAAQVADRSRRDHRSGARGLLVARLQRARQGHEDRRGGRARRQPSGSPSLGVTDAEFARIVAARSAQRNDPPSISTSCASSPVRSATRTPSTRCSATRSASRPTPRSSANASTSCTARATWRSSITGWCRRRRRRARRRWRSRIWPGVDHAAQFLGP